MRVGNGVCVNLGFCFGMNTRSQGLHSRGKSSWAGQKVPRPATQPCSAPIEEPQGERSQQGLPTSKDMHLQQKEAQPTLTALLAYCCAGQPMKAALPAWAQSQH